MIRFLTGPLKLIFKTALFLSLVAVVVAYARLANMDGAKGALEAYFKDRTGRQLTINGDIGLDLAFPPRLKAEGITIANPPWGSRKNMATIAKLEADVDLLPLIKGDVAVPRVRLVDVDVLLETGKNGENNWEDLAGFVTAAGPEMGMGLAGPIAAAGTIAVAGGVVGVLNGVTGGVISLPLPGANVILGSGNPVFNLIPGC